MNTVSRPLAAAALAAVIATAGCSSTTGPTVVQGGPATSPSAAPALSPSTPEATMAALNVEAPIHDVPWSQVGTGWMLAMWSPAPAVNPGAEPPTGEPTFVDSPQTLYLVNPEGGRYPIASFPAPGDGPRAELVDWSGDGTRALFYVEGPEASTVTEVDLHTGEQSSFEVEEGFSVTPRYTQPGGKAVLLVKRATIDGPPSLTRVDLAGNQQLTYPVDKLASKFNGSFLSTPDGTQLVMGTDSGLALMGNDGKPGSALPVADSIDCSPTRWWEPGSSVVAACQGPDYAYSRLWRVPINGDAPTPLTAVTDDSFGDYLGASSAWNLPAGTFVQAYGGCGYQYLAEAEGPDVKPTKVIVPKVDEHDSVIIVGAVDGHLQLQATLSCGSGQSLVDYDPEADTTTVVLGAGLNGGGVLQAVTYPGSE